MTNLNGNSDGNKPTTLSDNPKSIEDLGKLTIKSGQRCNSYESYSSSSSSFEESESSGNLKVSSAYITLAPRKLRQAHLCHQVTSSSSSFSCLEGREDRQIKAAGTRIVKQHPDATLLQQDDGNKAWMTQEILDMIQTRHAIFVDMNKHEKGSPEHLQWYAKYKVIKNNINAMSRKAKAVYNQSSRQRVKVETTKHLRNMISHNPRVNEKPVLYPSYTKPPSRIDVATAWKPWRSTTDKPSHVPNPVNGLRRMDSFRTVPQNAEGFRRVARLKENS